MRWFGHVKRILANRILRKIEKLEKGRQGDYRKGEDTVLEKGWI